MFKPSFKFRFGPHHIVVHVRVNVNQLQAPRHGDPRSMTTRKRKQYSRELRDISDLCSDVLYLPTTYRGALVKAFEYVYWGVYDLRAWWFAWI